MQIKYHEFIYNNKLEISAAASKTNSHIYESDFNLFLHYIPITGAFLLKFKTVFSNYDPGMLYMEIYIPFFFHKHACLITRAS